MAIVRPLSAVSLAAFAFLLAAPASAELPPQFTTWADFAAVTAQESIPYVLGVVDSIERAPDGKFVARAGDCSVAITVEREPAVEPNGQVIVGPSHIARVIVGEKRCK